MGNKVLFKKDYQMFSFTNHKNHDYPKIKARICRAGQKVMEYTYLAQCLPQETLSRWQSILHAFRTNRLALLIPR